MYNQQYQQTQQTAPPKQTDGFWFRKNHTYLTGVTNAPSNPMLGILNITLKDATPAQTPHGFLYNGMLSLAIGQIWFQIRMSANGAPMVVTESRKTGQDDNGKDKYFEPTNLNVATKAQILRYMEVVRSGQFAQQPVQQPMQQVQQPVYQQPVYQTQQPVYQQQAVQQPVYQTQQAPLDYAAHVPSYAPPAPQTLNQAPHNPVNQGNTELVTAGAGNDAGPVQVTDDDLPF